MRNFRISHILLLFAMVGFIIAGFLFSSSVFLSAYKETWMLLMVLCAAGAGCCAMALWGTIESKVGDLERALAQEHELSTKRAEAFDACSESARDAKRGFEGLLGDVSGIVDSIHRLERPATDEEMQIVKRQLVEAIVGALRDGGSFEVIQSRAFGWALRDGVAAMLQDGRLRLEAPERERLLKFVKLTADDV